MTDNVVVMMCQETRTDGDLGLTWKCSLPIHHDDNHYFQVVTIHDPLFREKP